MKKILLLCLIISGGILLVWRSAAPACTVCHSKKPSMVRMHAALRYKDCFICHGPGAIKSDERPDRQRVKDERCIRCHKE